MPTRSERRREIRDALSGSGIPSGRRSAPRSRDLFVAATIVGVITAVGIGIALFVTLGTDGDGSTFVARTDDEKAIEALARRSIEVLPQGKWPSLYESFTSEYQERCPLAQFVEAGVAGAEAVGANLAFLRFKRLESVSISGTEASAVVVGEVAGQSEYSLKGAFTNVDGTWKIAPAASTQGCEVFQRISG